MLLEKMERKHRHRRKAAAEPDERTIEAAEDRAAEDPRAEEERRAEARERRRRSQKSRSAAGMSPNITEQSVTLADGQRVPESEVDQGLFESLMGMGMGTLRRNKKGRASTKNRYKYFLVPRSNPTQNALQKWLFPTFKLLNLLSNFRENCERAE